MIFSFLAFQLIFQIIYAQTQNQWILEHFFIFGECVILGRSGQRVLLGLNQVGDAPVVLDAEATGADAGKGGEVLLAPHAMYLNYIAG